MSAAMAVLLAWCAGAQEEPVTDAVSREFSVYTGVTSLPLEVTSVAGREFTVYAGTTEGEAPVDFAAGREFTVYAGAIVSGGAPADAVAREFTVSVGDPAALLPPSDAPSREFSIYIPQADLQATSFTVDGLVERGAVVDLSWGVRNNGPRDVESAWVDCVYLSRSSVQLTDPIQLTCEVSPEGLAAGEGYGRVARVTIPEDLNNANRFLWLAVEASNSIGEDNESNNVWTAGPYSFPNEGEVERVLPQLDTIFVSLEAGNDETGLGTSEEPLRGLTLAVDHASSYANVNQPVEVRVSPGVYEEAFNLPPNVKLFGANPFDPGETVLRPPAAALKGNGNVVVMVSEGDDMALRDLTLSLDNAKGVTDATLLMVDNAEVAVDNVVMDGAGSSGSLGLMVFGSGSSDSKVTRTTFTGLDFGAMVEGSEINLTRNTFDNIAGDAITVVLAKGLDAGLVPTLGDENRIGTTGRNTFGVVSGFFIANETVIEVKAEQNDWGIYEEEDIAEQMFGPVDFQPFLGQVVVTPSLFVTVLDEDTGGPVFSAEVQLAPSSLPPVRQNSNGVYTITFVTAGTYSVAVTADGYFDSLETVVVPNGVTLVEAVVSLEPDGTLATPITHSVDTNDNNAVDLSDLLRAIQFYNARVIKCAAGTEDGYNVGRGDTFSCRNHAADYNPPDWSISLSETLRMVQLYNLGGYIRCDDGEDGYCAP